MDSQEVKTRLKKDLQFSYAKFNIKMDRKEYTEEQYQELKNTLIILEKMDVFPSTL